MLDQESMPGVYRVKGMNCPDVLLGPEKYRSLRKQGAFILLPEWTLRWKEIFQTELGLDEHVAKDFMQEMHTKLIYLDTGSMPVPTDHLNEFSDYAGLDYEVLQTASNHIQIAINEAIDRMVKNEQ